MEYSQVILEMLERIKILENKVKALEEAKANNVSVKSISTVNLDKVSAKYRPLAEYLVKSESTRVELSYAEIEAILGFRLPDTARNFKQSFWANTKTHSYASSWLEIGYKTRVDLNEDKVTFVKNTI